jgi:hypothetical protein
MTVSYDRTEISRVFTAIPCMGCTDWRGDAMRAHVGAVYLAVLHGKPLPPMLAVGEIPKSCCKSPYDPATTVTIDTTQIGGGQVMPAGPLPR